MTLTAWVIVIGVWIVILAAFELCFLRARRRQQLLRAMFVKALTEARDAITEAEGKA